MEHDILSIQSSDTVLFGVEVFNTCDIDFMTSFVELTVCGFQSWIKDVLCLFSSDFEEVCSFWILTRL